MIYFDNNATTQVDPASASGLALERQAQAGMEAMSAKFRELGGQVYVDAERVKASNKALG